ncbi:FHA domain-containing protein, partial [bacterium]|nr:FHA domain-containing protein [bacterium]
MTALILRYRLGDREHSAQLGPCVSGEVREFVLGRDADCALPLAERSVSRRHARLAWDGERWTIEDLGSRFGTQLNGALLGTPMPLAPGDRLVLGRLEFGVGIGGADPEAPTLGPDAEPTVLSLGARAPQAATALDT